MHQSGRRPRFATTRLATGPEVHYAEQGDPDGEVILFLPAYADSWFSYSRVLPLLAARYHAYALDQRGTPRAVGGHEAAPGLRFIGFVPMPGQLRYMGVEAKRAAHAIARQRLHPPAARHPAPVRSSSRHAP